MGKSKSKVEQVSRITPEQQSLLNNLIGDIQSGEFNLGETAQYQEGLGALSSLLEGFDPTRTTEAFQQQVADPARQQFSEETLPAIREQLIASGAGRGTGAERIQTQAGQRLEQGLSGQLAGLLQQGEQMGAQQQLSALGLLPSTLGAPQQSQLSAIQTALGISPFENVQYQKSSPFSTLLGGVGTGFGTAFGKKIV